MCRVMCKVDVRVLVIIIWKATMYSKAGNELICMKWYKYS